MTTTNPTPTQPETLEPCPFCGAQPETGITGAPECDNWRYVKCGDGHCPIRHSIFTVKTWNTRAAVTAPRGDVVDEALGMFKEVYDTVTFLGGETIHIAVGSELANKLIAAATSSPTPAESDEANQTRN